MLQFAYNYQHMATLIKDTHNLFQTLQSGGFSDQQAEALKAAFDNVDLSELATRDDIKDLRIEIYKITTAQTLIMIGAMVALAQVL
ncbi:MAG: hypothetical protein GY748_22770 [Planctomycetaceae bacterium]|nr:hypothetical protein [Planctomycetaceae bacterium]